MKERGRLSVLMTSCGGVCGLRVCYGIPVCYGGQCGIEYNAVQSCGLARLAGNKVVRSRGLQL